MAGCPSTCHLLNEMPSTTEFEKSLGAVPAHRHPLLLSNIASILDIFYQRVSVKALCRELIKKYVIRGKSLS